jgi:3-phenylpropionate/trans-cinnamate dioxygenase ferredoxin component
LPLTSFKSFSEAEVKDSNTTGAVEPVVHGVAAMSQWIDAMAAEEVRDGARRLLRADGHEIALFCVGERVHAIADSCPHQGASLATGKLDGGAVSCRAHGLRFDLTTGCMRGATGFGVRVYPVRIHDGQVQIDLTERPSSQKVSDDCPR